MLSVSHCELSLYL